VVPIISLLLCFVNLNLYNSAVAYEFDAEKRLWKQCICSKIRLHELICNEEVEAFIDKADV
jgi:hypothetical protein